jgi:hypothetical protein
MNEERRNANTSLMGKPERNKPLGRPRHSWGIILKCVGKEI